MVAVVGGKRRVIGLVLVLAIGLAIVAGAWFCVAGYRTATRMSRSEERLHAVMLAADLTGEYAETHHGQWPRSWSDLATLTPRSSGPLVWPRDQLTVQECVNIDFSADIAVLRHATPTSFTGITPKGSVYGVYRDYAITPLIERLNRSANEKPGGAEEVGTSTTMPKRE
jgi:hypothetical protein